MSTFLKRVEVNNWKSIQDLRLDLNQINVLIGPNGSGKSNLIQLFAMLNMMMTGSLQLFIGRQGGAGSLLYYGSKESPYCEGLLTFVNESKKNEYAFRLVYGAPDTLIFASEEVKFVEEGSQRPYELQFGAGHKESALTIPANQKGPASFVKGVLSRCRYFQFHDTSLEAYIRRNSRTEDSRYMYSNGGNVASILFRFQHDYPDEYSRVRAGIARVVSSFGDFFLEPQNNSIQLEWIDSYKGQRFGPHQLSDGSIRLIALLTLLNMPPEMAPSVIIIDEPELGLFPSAIEILADAIRSASQYCQIILATQSNRLVRYLNLDSIVCCSWKNGESEISQLSPSDEYHFLDEYTLGDYMSK